MMPTVEVEDAYIAHKNRLVTALDATEGLLTDLRSFNKDEWVVRYPRSEENGEMHILRLDLKLNSTPSHPSIAASSSSSSTDSTPSLLSQVESTLLDSRLALSLAHTAKLRQRVQDTSSKVLVTGDLNAGKSTFVNALLRREVMPVDQQPCTTAFCEVHDAAENGGREEVHVVKDGVVYDVANEETYERIAIEDMEEMESFGLMKLYLSSETSSLLNNGVVDISFIDAPGLNRDSLKTTAVFSRQEEIDVVVFVVSAENHFTLSAKEFLSDASREKAYVFIVVNKYDQIKNKEKCRRVVLEQIKQLSPRTWDDKEDLVHFVDSAAEEKGQDFNEMEKALRSFVLVKRAKSKLQPVATYLGNLLEDIVRLASLNVSVAKAELEEAQAELRLAKPVLDKMKSSRDSLEEGLENVEEDGTVRSTNAARRMLTEALEAVGQGKLVAMPTYPGIFGVWEYARNVRKALVGSLDVAVKSAEDEARVVTSDGVEKVKNLGEQHLPEGVERSKRVFMPEAMFGAIRGKGRRSLVGGGLGIGLVASRPEILETSFLDMFDVHHPLWILDTDSSSSSPDDTSLSVLSLISVGAGALTMVGGQAMGARGIIEGALRVSDLFSNESTRKWIAPVLGAAALGFTAYIVLELPSSIPRTVGRRIKAEVDSEAYVEGNAVRVGKETRKVLRLAAWDLRERFRGAMEESGRVVKGREEVEKRAQRALKWFEAVQERAKRVEVGQLEA